MLPAERQVVKSKYPVPLIARQWGFFYRLFCAKNPASVRLRNRNEDPHCLEVFITATTLRWRCFVDEETQLHCSQCSRRQQRECAIWALARTHRFWSNYYRTKNTFVGFIEHPLVKASREALVLLWLRLQRVYKINRDDVYRESEAQSVKGRKK